MNYITIILIVVLCAAAFIYMILKNRCINLLTNATKKKVYDDVIQNAQSTLCRRFLGNFNCDLFMMRAYYLKKDMSSLQEKALEMLSADYKNDQRKSFLELYYHIFLNTGELDMAEKFLNEIVKINDNAFVTYNQYTYNVLIEKQDDLIDTMEAEIEAKIYGGFALGTVVYLIAMQYLYKKDYPNAELYFKECLTCFHPNAFYVDPAKAYIKKLEAME